jgi:ribosomal protein S18 acetylase RimI-like enzyme
VARSIELVAFAATSPWRGVGTALLEGLEDDARAHGAERVWLVTTNDNVDALRFYQRRGYRLVALRPGAVDAARREHKPSIPETGDHGIPLRDELELEKRLARDA